MKRLISTLVASSLVGVAALGFSAGEANAQKSSSTDCASGNVGLLEYAACVTEE